MTNLIRSARLASEPRQLHLQERHFPTPSIPTFVPESHASMPLPVEKPTPLDNEKQIEPPQDEPYIASSISSAPIEIMPPALDSETEQRLLEDARKAHDLAVQQGHEEGYKKGLAEAHESLQEHIEAVKNLYESTSQALQSQINGLEDVVITLAFEAVLRVMGASLHDRDGVVAVVRETLAHVKDSEPITVRVAPSDYYLLAHDQSVLTEVHLGPTITLVADDRVVLGGCLIETSGGSLDGRLETQLQQFKDALLSAKRQRPDWKGGGHAV